MASTRFICACLALKKQVVRMLSLVIDSLRQMPSESPHLGGETTYWERVALTKWGRYLTKLEKQAVLKGSSLAARRRTALEIGCEGGRWSTLLSKEGWNLICTDINNDMLEVCKRRIPTAQCVLVKVTDTTIPSGTGTIDLLLCMEVPQVAESEWFIDEAFRVLTSGGVLVAAVMNSFSYRAILHRLLREIVTKTPRTIGNYQVSYQALRSRLVRKGFTLINEQGCCWFPFARDSNSALIPFFVAFERYLGLRHLASLSPWIVFVAQKD